jgi:diguanylate cyclase (GGDEF)-like protein/PAS domain S-box-containing protein
MRTRHDQSPAIRNLRWGFRLIALILVLFGAVYSWLSWQADKEKSTDFLASIAELGGKSLNVYFLQFEGAFRQLGDQMRDEGAVADLQRAQLLLRRFQAAHPQLRHVNLISDNGQFLATSVQGFHEHLPSIGATPSFRAARDAMRNGAVFTLGQPAIGMIIKEWMIPLRYGVKDSNGKLLFILQGSLPLVEQQALWQKLSVPDGTAIGLIRDDGYLLSRYPEPTGVDLDNLYGVPRNGALINHLRRERFPERGTVEGDANLNGDNNIFSYHRLSNYPVTFFVATPASNMRAIWWNQARLTYLLIVLLLAGSSAIYIWMYRRQLAWEREREHAESRSRLAASAMENTIEGIVITDADGVIVSVNAAFAQITGYTAEEAIGRKPGMLGSGHHDPMFYEEMWKQLVAEGHWQGEIWDRRKNGEMYAELLSISAVRATNAEVTHYVGVFNDISRYKDYEARLEFLANHDPLTGLPNRVLLHDRLDEAISRARRNGELVCVMFIDLDHFKVVNDSLGHAVGDRLLKEVSMRLLACVRDSDTVARLGGDEFTFVLEGLRGTEEAAVIAQKLLQRLDTPIAIDEHQLYAAASVGISFYPQDGDDVATLLQHADTAMYRAKEEGRDRYKFFSSDMNLRAQEFMVMANSLHVAVERDELFLEYQPRVDLASGKIVAVEALVRWRHPELGRIPPDRFIPLAEETGIINAVGDWVLRNACTQGRRWHDAGYPLRMAVNLSTRQFRRPDFVSRLQSTLMQTGFRPDMLDVEITESLMMHDPDSARRTLEEFSRCGIKIALDDFGTGYSSLSYLKRFPIDCVKIDRSFIHDIPDDPDSVAIVRTIIAMATSLRLSLVAEGVETERQRAHLRGEGCQEAQGFHFSRPVSAAALERLLKGEGDGRTVRRDGMVPANEHL